MRELLGLGSLDVCRWGRRHASAGTWRRRWFLRALRLPTTGRVALLWLLRLFGRGAIFLEQLLGRVVLGGFLEALNGSVAFLVQLLEVDLGVANAVVEVAHERVTDAVESGQSDL